MSMMRTANPFLNQNTFANAATAGGDDTMTAQGAASKTLFLLGLALITAGWVWHVFYSGFNTAVGPGVNAQSVIPWLIGGTIGGLVFAIATSFKPNWSPVTAPLYALCEGMALGGISAVFEANWPGIALQAVGLTFGVAGCMLLAYKLGLIRATEKFKMGVMAATGAIFFVYLFAMIAQFFFHSQVAFLNSASPLSIGISVVIVVVAALNLVLDFDMIEQGAAQGAPKYMEWYGAFALMVTLVWLYLELIRLLAKLRDRR